MGSGQNLWSCLRLWSLAIFSLFLLIIISSTHVRFKAEAVRPSPKVGGFSQMRGGGEEESNMMMTRAQIGSRPPRCERRCSTCGHCEAIQVPTNPQVNNNNNNNGGIRRKNSSSTMNSNVAYAKGGNDESNYKPMSWKCKCGNLIFNP